MKISFSWLKEYIKTDLTSDEVAFILTSIGLEVGRIEDFESIKGSLEGLVVGEVITCVEHENSDHLRVTTVDVGREEALQIVCGAANVAVGQKVVVATIGTKLYSSDDSFVIKRSKIRGVESFGMICAEDEIGIGTSHDGIIVLPSDIAVGTLLKDYYDIQKDSIIEVDITPNRADAISHYGVARDLYAYCMANGIEAKLQKPPVADFNTQQKEDSCVEIEVINSESAPRYSGIVLKNIKITDSPQWLQKRLSSIGLRPINNVVDVTNYVMHSYGQPLHAFDVDKIGGNKIIVRNAKRGEKLTTLDDNNRVLSENDMIICDIEKPMCIAGVLGGADSGVTDKTNTIFIESAYFNPSNVRKSSKLHGINTDSSFRFERGTDPNNVIYALMIAAEMIMDLSGARVASKIIDIYPNPIEDFQVEINYQKITSLIGKKIEIEKIEKIFKGLEYEVISKTVEPHDDIVYKLKVPFYRNDVRRDVDVIEDILRIYGYNNIEVADGLKSNISHRQNPDNHLLKNLIGNQLSSNGFFEIMNNSLTKSLYYDNSQTFSSVRSVNLLNSLSSDLNVMRQTLLFGGLESVAYNTKRQKSSLKFYEFGKCYQHIKDNQDESSHIKSYSESEHLGLWITGNRMSQSWLRKEEAVTLYDLKAYLQNVFLRLGIKFENVESFSNDIFSNALEYKAEGGKSLAQIGVVSRDILKIFDIKDDVFYADISWDNILLQANKKTTKIKDVPKFPEVSRDLALLLDKSIAFRQIEELALSTERKLLKQVTLFDIYEGNSIEPDKKSYAINFILQDSDKTLAEAQIDMVMQKLQKAFETQLGAKIRK